MSMLDTITALWEHSFWADARLLEALEASADARGTAGAHAGEAGANGGATAEALREHAHVLGAEETWLARIEGRSPAAPVWPEATLEAVRTLSEATERAFRAYLRDLTEEGLATSVTYRNSAGDEFTNRVADILLHVALHGQYHRGKVNLLLRQGGHEPAPVDYIAYVRGAAAATTRDAAPTRTDTAAKTHDTAAETRDATGRRAHGVRE